MLKLIIEDDEGRKTVVPFVRDEITIGRQEGNTIRLTERNVSRRHARLVRLNGHVVLEDLGSYNGTRINGERVAGQLPLKEGDLIQIGDYDLALQVEGQAATAPTGAITAKVPASRRADVEEDDARPQTMSDGEDEAEDDEDQAGGGDENDHTPPPAEARRNATSIIRMDQAEAERPRRVERVPEDEQPRLVVLSPNEFKGQEFDCNRTELRVGRTSENDIALDHRSLSRTHAKVVREDTGEWRVIDMQSANGMTVNGESYAQATLSHGDIIEMGHVKLRFVGPGTLAEDIAAQQRSGSKKWVAAAVVFVSIAAGAALFVVKGQDLLKGPDTTPTPPVVANDPQPVPEPQTPPDTKPPDVKPPETAVATPPQAVPPDQEFKAAVQAADWASAGAKLAALRKAQALSPKALNDLQQSLDAEKQANKYLVAAGNALKAGKNEEAIKLLNLVPKSTVFASQREALSTELQEALQKTAQQTQLPPEEPPATEPSPRKSTVQASSAFMKSKSAEDVAKELPAIQAEVGRLNKEQNTTEALEIAKDCVAIAPEVPECHLMIGALYAKNRDVEASKRHYEKFLQLTPEGYPKRDLVIKALSNLQSPQPKGSTPTSGNANQ